MVLLLGGIKFELINNPAPKEMQTVESYGVLQNPYIPNNKVLPTLNEISIYNINASLPSTNVQNPT